MTSTGITLKDFHAPCSSLSAECDFGKMIRRHEKGSLAHRGDRAALENVCRHSPDAPRIPGTPGTSGPRTKDTPDTGFPGVP